MSADSCIVQGAVAILEYNAIESPLAQPRNLIIGHFLSALSGVGIAKLFMLSSRFQTIRWIAGAMACGVASALMTVTKTIYPPAGATAVLAAIDPTVGKLGWYFLPLVLLSTALTLVISLLLNNIQRQYPMYWWTPAELGKPKKHTEGDIEKEPKRSTSETSSSSQEGPYPHHRKEVLAITINAHHVEVPNDLYLAEEETELLEILRNRLRETLPAAAESETTSGDSKD